MNKSHLCQIPHSARNTPHDPNQLQHRILPIIMPQKRIQCSILHVLHYNHIGSRFRDHTLQKDHIGVVELAHNTGFGQKVETVLVGSALFEGFDCYGNVAPRCNAETAFAHVAKLTCGKLNEIYNI